MAKILVADDNSNVQKTVALALADLGVEVVGVNNGEAAVRKLADISPDLVLADIFMPVRNGYEVCEFVKRDSRFSNIPVVLLVGAFDPLDEREAQRVSADGILKKPFVPPDPLIAMVKTLLDRTIGDRLVAVGASKPAVAAQNNAGGVAVAEKPSPAPEPAEEVPLQEFHPPVDRISFGEGEHPVAFQQLLETAAQSATPGLVEVEPVDDDQILTSSRHASLGDPIFWRTETSKPENEEENSEAEEEESDLSSDLPIRAWQPDGEAMSRAETKIEPPVESFELVRDDTEEEAGKAPAIAESSSLIVQDAASQASLNVESGKPEDLAANPIEWMASVPHPPAEEIPEEASEWPAPALDDISDDNLGAIDSHDLKSGSAPATPESTPKVAAPAMHSDLKPAPPPFPTPAQPPIQPVKQDLEEKSASTPMQDWADLAASIQPSPMDSAAEKAKSSPAMATQTPVGKRSETAPTNSAPPVSKPQTQNIGDTARSIPKQEMDDYAASLSRKPIEPATEMPKSSPASKLPVQSPEDTARSIPKHDWADMAASLESKSTDAVVVKLRPAAAPLGQAPAGPAASPQPADASVAQTSAVPAGNSQREPTNSQSPGSPDPALVEAVVQRVLEKMRPQVVDIITKEFLRPVVQALVHREITKR